jgi:hypothetical protein
VQEYNKLITQRMVLNDCEVTIVETRETNYIRFKGVVLHFFINLDISDDLFIKAFIIGVYLNYGKMFF